MSEWSNIRVEPYLVIPEMEPKQRPLTFREWLAESMYSKVDLHAVMKMFGASNLRGDPFWAGWPSLESMVNHHYMVAVDLEPDG